jgi:hypothetical protein
MSEAAGETPKPRRRRPRTKQTYRYHKNAVSITVYDPAGQTIPAPVRKMIEESVWSVANAHGLLINIAHE